MQAGTLDDYLPYLGWVSERERARFDEISWRSENRGFPHSICVAVKLSEKYGVALSKRHVLTVVKDSGRKVAFIGLGDYLPTYLPTYLP